MEISQPWLFHGLLGRVVGTAACRLVEAVAEAEGTWQGHSCCNKGPRFHSPAGSRPWAWARADSGSGEHLCLPLPEPGSTEHGQCRGSRQRLQGVQAAWGSEGAGSSQGCSCLAAQQHCARGCVQSPDTASAGRPLAWGWEVGVRALHPTASPWCPPTFMCQQPVHSARGGLSLPISQSSLEPQGLILALLEVCPLEGSALGAPAGLRRMLYARG